MQITFTKSGYGQITVEARDNGALKATCAYRFNQQKHYTQAAKTLGVPVQELMARIDAFRAGRDDGPDAWVINGDIREPANQLSNVYVRGLNETTTTAIPYRTFKEAVEGETNVTEPVIYWSDREQLCAVDVDYHELEYNSRPTLIELELVAERVLPRPFAYWVTHGRGLRLMYAPLDGFTAEELAAVACLSVADPRCRVELKTITRHPLHKRGEYSCGPIHWLTPSSDVDTIKQWLGAKEVDGNSIEDWLSVRGLAIGRRYPHSECPVAPSAKDGRSPVQVYDQGVFCFLCAGKGRVQGSRVAGWFPFRSLVAGQGKGAVPTIGLCARNFTHWQQASFIVAESTGLSGEIAQLAYGACIKLVHGADPRVRKVFTAGKNLIRLDGAWATLKGEYFTKDIQPIIASLPATQYLDAEGAVKVDGERVSRLVQTSDITDYGYPALTPIWGHRIYSHKLPLRDSSIIPVVLQTRELSHEDRAPFRPRYVRGGNLEKAWQTLEGPFPGVNRDLVTLLIAARGCMEGQVGLPPFFFFTGPSGAAKTSHVLVAAAIIGDKNRSVVLGNDEARARAGILEAKSKGSFCTFNEASKGAKLQSGITPLDFILNLTPDSTSHSLYVGPVPLGALPVLIWTDTELGAEIKQSSQLARRLIHCHLPSRLEWVEPIRRYGINQIHLLRTVPTFADPCNVIMSSVIDRFFSTEPRDIFDIAGELGFHTLENSTEAVEGNETLKRFYTLVASLPPLSGTLLSRWPGDGWKLIDLDHTCEVTELWQSLDSRKCSEVDWARLVGASEPIKFESRTHGRKTVVRFT